MAMNKNVALASLSNEEPETLTIEDFEQYMAQPSNCLTSDDEVEEYKRQFFTYIIGLPLFFLFLVCVAIVSII